MKKFALLSIIAAALFGGENSLVLKSYKPGMGTVMMEYGYRFYVLYYAAKAKNWELAKCQLHEQLKIQEVGEDSRL